MSKQSRMQSRNDRKSMLINKDTKLFLLACAVSLIVVMSVFIIAPFCSAEGIWFFTRIDNETSVLDSGIVYIVDRGGDLYMVRKVFPNDVYILDKTWYKTVWLDKVIK